MWPLLVLLIPFGVGISVSFLNVQTFNSMSDKLLYLLLPDIKPPWLTPQAIIPEGSIELKNQTKSRTDQMVEDILYRTITTGLAIKEDLELPNLKVPSPLSGTLYMNRGKVTGLESYDEVEVKSFIVEGHMETAIQLHFTNLQVTYEELFMNYYGLSMFKGSSGKVKVLSNKLVGKLSVVKTSEILDRITNNECILYLKSVHVTDLGEVEVDIYADTKQRRVYISRLVHKVINSIVQMLTDQITLALTEFSDEHLPESNALICRDHELRQLIDEQNRYKQNGGKIIAPSNTQSSTANAASLSPTLDPNFTTQTTVSEHDSTPQPAPQEEVQTGKDSQKGWWSYLTGWMNREKKNPPTEEKDNQSDVKEINHEEIPPEKQVQIISEHLAGGQGNEVELIISIPNKENPIKKAVTTVSTNTN